MEKIDLKGKRILITGAAGFIGGNLAKRIVSDGDAALVAGVDNMNDYYDVRIKEWRLQQVANTVRKGYTPADNVGTTDSASAASAPSGMNGRTYNRQGEPTEWKFCCGDIADKGFVMQIFAEIRPDIVVNLAAQAGVRYSITNPDTYIHSNLIGFYNILEACRHSYDAYAGSDSRKYADNSNSTGDTDQAGNKSETFDIHSGKYHDVRTGYESYPGVQHLVYASSSSVYGTNQKVPFSTDDKVDDPVSLYAATKKADELMAHAYAKLYNIPCTGLRFFTVYGPAGRPDMAYWGFTDKLRAGEKIRIFNYGNCSRDFTYIDDVIEGIVRVMQGAPSRERGKDGLPVPPYALYNIGGGHPESLLEFVDILQQELVRACVLPGDYDFAAHRELVPMQPGDVPVTYADTTALSKDFGYRPSTDLRTGLRKFAEWYRAFYMF